MVVIDVEDVRLDEADSALAILGSDHLPVTLERDAVLMQQVLLTSPQRVGLDFALLASVLCTSAPGSISGMSGGVLALVGPATRAAPS